MAGMDFHHRGTQNDHGSPAFTEPQRGGKEGVGVAAFSSAAQPPGQPQKGGFAVRAIRDIVAMCVVLQDCEGIRLVQPLTIKACNQEASDLW